MVAIEEAGGTAEAVSAEDAKVQAVNHLTANELKRARPATEWVTSITWQGRRADRRAA